MPAIDGLRALAVTAVFVYHVDRSWLPGGFFGVDVFFVVSGYLITSLLLAEIGSTGWIRLGAFWGRRARRLLPALFLMLGVVLLVGATLERGRIALRGDALASIFYVANWRFVFEHLSYFQEFGRPPLLRHLWSLAVEEQFYLLWPPLLLLAVRLRRMRVVPWLVGAAALGSAALSAALYVPGEDNSRVFYGTDTRAAPLLVGVLLAFVWKPDALPRLRRPGSRPVLDALSVTALAGVVWAFVAVHDDDAFVYRGGFLVVGVFAAVLLATVVHPHSLLARPFARPVPRWLGERSYAIYLWHWPVLAFTRPGVDIHMARPLVVILQAAVTLLLSDASYRFVERPIRSGGLRRLRPLALRPSFHVPAPLAVGVGAVALLTGLAVLTPRTIEKLPRGFTPAALASSQHAATHLVLPSGTTTSGTTTAPSAVAGPAAVPQSGPILAVGDSVMLGASDALGAAIGRNLHLDAVISRQPRDLIDRLAAYRARGSLPQRVIVHIGDNGPVYYADWQRLKAALAGVPLVVLVNVRIPRSWESEVNATMRNAVIGWRHATVADWYRASSGPGVVSDGAHTTAEGARRFAALIARALRSPNLGAVTS